jgi:hypothetical protein
MALLAMPRQTVDHCRSYLRTQPHGVRFVVCSKLSVRVTPQQSSEQCGLHAIAPSPESQRRRRTHNRFGERAFANQGGEERYKAMTPDQSAIEVEGCDPDDGR